MAEFLELVSAREADRVLSRFDCVAADRVPLLQAVNRVLAEPLVANEPLPAWPRARMDGYAVRAADTAGASEGMPGYLRVVGRVGMGEDASSHPPLGVGECHEISTGGMLPPGADAVVMVEYTAAEGDELSPPIRATVSLRQPAQAMYCFPDEAE